VIVIGPEAYLAAIGIILGVIYAIYRGEPFPSLVKYGLLFGVLLPLLYIIVVLLIKIIEFVIIIGVILFITFLLLRVFKRIVVP